VEIDAKLLELRLELDSNLASGSWRMNLPGREILSRFTGDHAEGIAYEVLRNLIIARMKIAGYEPTGMRRVIEAILAG
jgi:hypothetical protein